MSCFQNVPAKDYQILVKTKLQTESLRCDALLRVPGFKPRTSNLRTCLHAHNSLPKSQCDGNFELLQTKQTWNFNSWAIFWLVKTELQMVKHFVAEAFWQTCASLKFSTVVKLKQKLITITLFWLLRKSLTLKNGFQELIRKSMKNEKDGPKFKKSQ